MTGTIVAGRLSGFLDGDLKAIVNNDRNLLACTAPDHGVMFSR